MVELQQCNVGRLPLPLVIGRPAVILCISLRVGLGFQECLPVPKDGISLFAKESSIQETSALVSSFRYPSSI